MPGESPSSWGIPSTAFWGISITVFSWGIPVTVFSWGIPITVFSCPRSGNGGFPSSEFPDYHASPSHPSSRLFDFLLLWTWLKRFPSRSDSPVIFRMGRLATPFSILSTSLKGSQIRPLRGRNWRQIPTSMRSMLETHGLLTWSVMAFIRKLHDGNLLPKDDQSISQLQKSFSKAYGNWASGLSSSAVFVTLKRRQLPLSRMVPSVSDVLTRIPLSDHLISPRGVTLPPHQKPRLPVQFRLMMSANPLRFSYYRTKGKVT